MMTAETKATHGLLIDYEYCTGCQSCEVACKEEHGARARAFAQKGRQQRRAHVTRKDR